MTTWRNIQLCFYCTPAIEKLDLVIYSWSQKYAPRFLPGITDLLLMMSWGPKEPLNYECKRLLNANNSQCARKHERLQHANWICMYTWFEIVISTKMTNPPSSYNFGNKYQNNLELDSDKKLGITAKSICWTCTVIWKY